MSDCLFCKIINGEIPSQKVYEDDLVYAFKDINPMAPVHILVIPKEHFDSLLYCPKDILGKVMSVAQKIAQASITTLGAKGVNLVNNTNPIAGQTVMHFHVHVIPRYSDDDQ